MRDITAFDIHNWEYTNLDSSELVLDLDLGIDDQVYAHIAGIDR